MTFHDTFEPTGPLSSAPPPASRRGLGAAAAAAVAALVFGVGGGVMWAHANSQTNDRPTGLPVGASGGFAPPTSIPGQWPSDTGTGASVRSLPRVGQVVARADGQTPAPAERPASLPHNRTGAGDASTPPTMMTMTTQAPVPGPKFTSVDASPGAVPCKTQAPFPTVTVGWATTNAKVVILRTPTGTYEADPTGSLSIAADCSKGNSVSLIAYGDKGVPADHATASWNYLPPPP